MASKAEPEQDAQMANIEARIAAMLAAAQEKADEIIKNAGDKALGAVSEAQKALDEERQKAHEWLDEYVEVFLFKDNKDYKDDVFVAVNGEGCQIKRGERVKVKRKFALVLDQSANQDRSTAALIDEKTSEYERQLKSI